MNRPDTVQLDLLIIGGGIAGLWLTNLLHGRGYRVALLEADRIGSGQSLASQGMIHGGLKYALGGRLTAASEAIAAMPARWRDCLTGTGEVDLRGLQVLAEHNLLFADGSGLGRLTTFFASRMLQGRIARLDQAAWPGALSGCSGWVYALDDLVLSTPQLLETLLAPVAHLSHTCELQAQKAQSAADGWQLQLSNQRISARRLILTAGVGNQKLLRELGLTGPAMQIRPLQQVIVRHPDLLPLYGHCLTGMSMADTSQPRLTITSHPDGDHWLWYLGGQLASHGASLSSGALIDFAREELASCLPWLNLEKAEFDTLAIDRAEPASAGQRPDQAFAEAHGNCIVCWPTKLSLAPDLGDRVQRLLPEPAGLPAAAIHLPPARVGRPRWEH